MSGVAWLVAGQRWDALPSFFFQTLIFLLVSTSILYQYLDKFSKPDFFIQFYLLTIAVKILAYGAYNLVMIMDDRPGAPQNVVWFIMLYFLFTALEILFLYQKKMKH